MNSTVSTIMTGVVGATAVESVDHIPIESLPEIFDIALKVVIGIVTLWRLIRPKRQGV